VLRVVVPGERDCLEAPDLPALLARMRGPAAADARLELLFIRRADNPRDPWSGNVALPGGRREPGESDADAAVREAHEEVGLALAPPAFVCLGVLPHRPVFAGGRRREGAAVCPFVWLQLAGAQAPLRLQAAEVSAALWVPLRTFLLPHAVDRRGVVRNYAHLIPGVRALPAAAVATLGLDRLHFPAVHLPTPLPPLADGATAFAPAGAAVVAVGRPLDAAPAFPLWGLTLGATADLLAAAGEATAARTLTWPPVSFEGAVPNAIVTSVCGVIEIARYPRLGCHPGRAAAGVAGVAGVAAALWAMGAALVARL
jgi:8-oxo-dGTP pyrophosphatase MutT (NUDIX family)